VKARLARIGLAVGRRPAPARGVLILLAVVLLLPSVLPLHPLQIDLDALLLPPSRQHWLGTDENGRDVLIRVLVGARVTLGIGLAATLLALTLGTAIGAAAALGGGLLDACLMRAVDAALAFPSLFAILLCAAVLTPGSPQLVLLIGITGWMSTARLVRGQVQDLLGSPYVEAGRALGASGPAVIVRHLLPNLRALLGVAGLVQLGRAILAEATISFLGFGIQPPAPTWGNLLIGAQNYVFTAPWLALAPGVAITATLLLLSTLGVGGPVSRLMRVSQVPSSAFAASRGAAPTARALAGGREEARHGSALLGPVPQEAGRARFP
jgi:peptide/nickel transport system permease protein